MSIIKKSLSAAAPRTSLRLQDVRNGKGPQLEADEPEGPINLVSSSPLPDIADVLRRSPRFLALGELPVYRPVHVSFRRDAPVASGSGSATFAGSKRKRDDDEEDSILSVCAKHRRCLLDVMEYLVSASPVSLS